MIRWAIGGFMVGCAGVSAIGFPLLFGGLGGEIAGAWGFAIGLAIGGLLGVTAAADWVFWSRKFIAAR
jgi:hypothetical protein